MGCSKTTRPHNFRGFKKKPCARRSIPEDFGFNRRAKRKIPTGNGLFFRELSKIQNILRRLTWFFLPNGGPFRPDSAGPQNRPTAPNTGASCIQNPNRAVRIRTAFKLVAVLQPPPAFVRWLLIDNPDATSASPLPAGAGKTTTKNGAPTRDVWNE